MVTKFDNGNIFTTHHTYGKYAKVTCSCFSRAGNRFLDTDVTPYTDRKVSSCPKCGTRVKGTMGKVNIAHASYKLNYIGDKSFGLTLHMRRYNLNTGKFTQNSKYELNFNYLDKQYDIKINGKDPRTKDIGGYYKRVLSKVPLNEVMDLLDKETGTSFWKCLLGMFNPVHTSFGEALNSLIKHDYSSIEIIATSRLGDIVALSENRWLRGVINKEGSMFKGKGKNLREVLGLTRGQINGIIRMTNYFLDSGENRKYDYNSVRVLDMCYHLTKKLPIQYAEDLVQMASDEGYGDYLLNNYETLLRFMDNQNYLHDPNRFIRYLLRELKLEQGILNPDEGMRLLRDYTRMMKDLEREPERYPTSLKKVHDIAAMNYRVVSDVMKERNFKRRSEEHEALKHRGRRFSFTLPETPKDLVKEGTSLHHCVASYVDDVIRDKCLIVFMRGNAEVEKPHVTIEVRNKRVVQARGQSNRQCTQEERDAIRAWANAKELEYQGGRA